MRWHHDQGILASKQGLDRLFLPGLEGGQSEATAEGVVDVSSHIRLADEIAIRDLGVTTGPRQRF